MRRMELADFTRRHFQTLERHVRQFEPRQEIVAERRRRPLGLAIRAKSLGRRRFFSLS
jgi:hypothetical protein